MVAVSRPCDPALFEPWHVKSVAYTFGVLFSSIVGPLVKIASRTVISCCTYNRRRTCYNKYRK